MFFAPPIFVTFANFKIRDDKKIHEANNHERKLTLCNSQGVEYYLNRKV